MVQLIVGEKGKGKTKILLDKVNEASKTTNGNIVFLDKDTKHMYELVNKIRLINTSDYCISSDSEFLGFISGIISADHDLEQIYIDGLKRLITVSDEEAFTLIKKLDKFSEKFNISITISISVTKDSLPNELAEKVLVAL